MKLHYLHSHSSHCNDWVGLASQLHHLYIFLATGKRRKGEHSGCLIGILDKGQKKVISGRVLVIVGVPWDVLQASSQANSRFLNF